MKPKLNEATQGAPQTTATLGQLLEALREVEESKGLTKVSREAQKNVENYILGKCQSYYDWLSVYIASAIGSRLWRKSLKKMCDYCDGFPKIMSLRITNIKEKMNFLHDVYVVKN